MKLTKAIRERIVELASEKVYPNEKEKHLRNALIIALQDDTTPLWQEAKDIAAGEFAEYTQLSQAITVYKSKTCNLRHKAIEIPLHFRYAQMFCKDKFGREFQTYLHFNADGSINWDIAFSEPTIEVVKALYEFREEKLNFINDLSRVCASVTTSGKLISIIPELEWAVKEIKKAEKEKEKPEKQELKRLAGTVNYFLSEGGVR